MVAPFVHPALESHALRWGITPTTCAGNRDRTVGKKSVLFALTWLVLWEEFKLGEGYQI